MKLLTIGNLVNLGHHPPALTLHKPARSARLGQLFPLQRRFHGERSISRLRALLHSPAIWTSEGRGEEMGARAFMNARHFRASMVVYDNPQASSHREANSTEALLQQDVLVRYRPDGR